MLSSKCVLILGAIAALSALTQALNNSLGLTPPMGWNTWNKYGCLINQDIIYTNTDKIVELGLDKLGYNYVNIDDCWLGK